MYNGLKQRADMKKAHKRKSIKRQMMFAFGATFVLVCISYTFAVGLMFSGALKNSLQTSLSEVAKCAADTMDNWVESNFSYLEALSSCPEFYDITNNRDTILAKMEETVKERGYYDMIVSDKSGLGYSLTKESVDIGGNVFFRLAAVGRNFVTDPMYLWDDGNLLVVFSVPIYANSEKPVGTLTAALKAENFLTGKRHYIRHQRLLVYNQ